MTGTDCLLKCQSVRTLALARLIVLTVPFRFMAPWFSRAPDTSSRDGASVLRVRKAVTTAPVPGNTVCPPQTMAAKAVLAWPSCGFHLGGDFDVQGKLIAYAWLVVGDTIVGAAR